MRVVLSHTNEQVAEARKQAYLADWSVGAQLEAYAEAAAGRPEKLNKMLADFELIRKNNPKPGDQQ